MASDQHAALIFKPHLAMPMWVAACAGLVAAIGAVALANWNSAADNSSIGAPLLSGLGIVLLAFVVDRAVLGRSLTTPMARLLTTWLVLRLLIGIICTGLWLVCLVFLTLGFIGGSSRVDVLLLAVVYLPGWIPFGVVGNSAAGPTVERWVESVAAPMRRGFAWIPSEVLQFGLGACFAAVIVYAFEEISYQERLKRSIERGEEIARQEAQETKARQEQSTPKRLSTLELPSLELYFPVGISTPSSIIRTVVHPGTAGYGEHLGKLVGRAGEHSKYVAETVSKLGHRVEIDKVTVVAWTDPTGDAKHNQFLAAKRGLTAVRMVNELGIGSDKISLRLSPEVNDRCQHDLIEDRGRCLESLRRVDIEFSGIRLGR